MGELLINVNEKRKFIVITENDVSAWDDKTGEEYHYPSRYQKLITPGVLVVYYKGASREKSHEFDRKSPNPHYFGMAKIESIRVDERNKKNYFAKIVDYVEFDVAVDFKDSQGHYLEQKHIMKSNYWRDAVRLIDEETYNSIIAKVGYKVIEPIETNEISLLNDVLPIPLDDIHYIVNTVNPLKIQSKKEAKNSQGSKRYTKNSKKTGDRGEEIVYKYLKDKAPEENYKDIRWLAKENITPGYDIEYIDHNDQRHCVEVKATATGSFVDFILTVNEWRAAMEQEYYEICLVSKCLSANPEIYHLGNPYQLVNEMILEMEPLSFKLKLKEDKS